MPVVGINPRRLIVFIGLPPENGRGGQLVRCPPPAGIRETILSLGSPKRGHSLSLFSKKFINFFSDCLHTLIHGPLEQPHTVRSCKGQPVQAIEQEPAGAGPRCRAGPERPISSPSVSCGKGIPPAFRRRYHALGGNYVFVKFPAIPMPPLLMGQVLGFVVGPVKKFIDFQRARPQLVRCN